MVARTNSPESMKLVSKISAVSDSELLALSSGVFGFFFCKTDFEGQGNRTTCLT